jgi:hypothetical protein
VRKDGNTFSSHLTDRSLSSNSTERNSTGHTTPYHTVPLFCPTYKLKFPKLRHNSITIPVVHELVTAYDLFDRDDHVRVIVITADHTAVAFCSRVRVPSTYFWRPALNDNTLLFYFRRTFLRAGRPYLARMMSDSRQGRSTVREFDSLCNTVRYSTLCHGRSLAFSFHVIIVVG